MVRKVYVVPYDPAWPARYEEEGARICAVFGAEVLAVHHVGSTAVPGLVAKPIIDILAEARALAAVDGFNEALGLLGYRRFGEFGVPGRRFFAKGSDEARTYHLHVFQARDPSIGTMLAFRDYLRAHADAAREYGLLKERLAAAFPEDIEAYKAGKAPFIAAVLARCSAAIAD